MDAGFFDILDHTQFPKDLMELAAMGEARYGRFALLTDIVYLKAGLGASITRSRGTDAINGAVGASAGLKTWMVEAQFAAAYEMARWSGLFSPGATTALDLYAGGRAWWQRGEVNLAVSGTLNVFDLTFDARGLLLGYKKRELVRSIGRRAHTSPVRSHLEFCLERRRRRLRRRQQVFVAGACTSGARNLPVKNRHLERHARLQGA